MSDLTSFDPSPEEIRAELERIQKNTGLKTRKKLLKILVYLVNQRLEAGDGAKINQYDIAEAIWPGKPFDTEDTLVRSNVSQLRVLLANYYEGDGRNDPIQIVLPAEGYVPIFKRQTFDVASTPPIAISLLPHCGSQTA